MAKVAQCFLLGFFLIRAQEAVAAAPSPPAVTVATVAAENIAPVKTYVGHVIAIQSAQIVPRVTAFIDSVAVKQGSNVKAGQILFELQKAQYQNAVQSAAAQLASVKAALSLANISLERAQKLAKRDFESIANLNQAQATYAEAKAKVEQTQASLAEAQLNLSYCTISSPIAGRIGPITLTKGNLVTPSTPALATVVQINPIRVEFPVPIPSIVAAEKRTGHAASTIAAGIIVNLKLPNGSPYDHPGRVAFLDNSADLQTGSLNVYADFPNPEALLLPGIFVDVSVHRATPEMRLLVPVQAVQIVQKGSYVLVVGKDDKVRQQFVKLGPQIGEKYVAESGLVAGDRVIIEGVQKVKPSQIVKPVEASGTGPEADGSADSGH